MPLNEDIVNIEKPNGTCSMTLAVDGFLRLFFQPLIFPIKDSRSA